MHTRISLFNVIAHLGNWGVVGFVFFDLEFGIGPVLLYTVCAAVEVTCMRWVHLRWRVRKRGEGADQVQITMNPALEQATIEEKQRQDAQKTSAEPRDAPMASRKMYS